MSETIKPGDPADKAADGAFGGKPATAHRSGYGDVLARVEAWLRKHPSATLASRDGWTLLAEIDRLREDNRELRNEWESASERALTSLDDIKALEAHVVELRDQNDRLRAELEEALSGELISSNVVNRLIRDLDNAQITVTRLERELARLRAELARCKPIADAAVEYLDAVDNASVAVAWDRKFELERAIDAARGEGA